MQPRLVEENSRVAVGLPIEMMYACVDTITRDVTGQ